MTHSTLVSFRTSATAINESLFHSGGGRLKFAATMTDGIAVVATDAERIKKGMIHRDTLSTLACSQPRNLI